MRLIALEGIPRYNRTACHKTLRGAWGRNRRAVSEGRAGHLGQSEAQIVDICRPELLFEVELVTGPVPAKG